MNPNIVSTLIIFSALFVSACNRDFVFDDYKTIPQIGWHKDSITTFNIPKLDTTKTYNLFINARNNNKYAFSNLFLITKMEYPNGKHQIDTLEYEMAHPNGEWIGTGGHVIENKLWYKQHFPFQEKGQYTIQIGHAMRRNGNENGIEFLKGITDIGFRIEEAK